MARLDRALLSVLGWSCFACTVDSEDGMTSLGSGTTVSTTFPTTTASTTAPTTTATTATEGSSSTGDDEDTSTPVESSGTASGTESGSESPSTESGGADEQPADGMYSACESAIDCVGVQGCVDVMPNVGFCTNANCTDATACVASPGGTAMPACVAATLNGSKTMVCALDCSGGASCPGGMECAALGPAMVCV